MESDDILGSWRGQTAVLGTKHQKESVIAPLLAEAFGIHVMVPTDFDTDQFGTFTRDIARTGTPYETVKKKALAAAAYTGHTLALASEGSFGTHPSLPFLPWHTELVILIDLTHQIEIVGRYEGSGLKAAGTRVTSVDAAIATASSWGFPAQGVILRSKENSHRHIYKDITTETELREVATTLLGGWFTHSLYLETDMRAHRCPARQATIKQATEDLIARARQRCPQCGCPGFVIGEVVRGLPCSQCGGATDTVRSLVSQCQRCQYKQERPTEQTLTDPGNCSYCNP